MTEIPKSDIQSLYASLMSEVKARLASIDAQLQAIQSTADNQHKTFLAEFSYLQLRRITELIALSVLAAHNGYSEFRRKDLLKEWNADELFRRIEKLNPSAFPRKAAFLDNQKEGLMRVALPAVRPETKDELCKIYRESCDKLHTGHLRSVLRSRNKIYDIPYIKKSTHTLCAMLNEHVTEMPNGEMMRGSLNLGSLEPVRCQWLHPTPPPPPGKYQRSGPLLSTPPRAERAARFAALSCILLPKK